MVSPLASECPPTLRRSPLHERHVAAGARFAEFSGWEMPLEYAGGGVLAEHRAVREQVGIFDVSHLGKATLTGAGAAGLADSVLTNALDRITAGQAQYTLCCSQDGGVVDDLIAYRRSDDELFLVPNAANTAAVVQMLDRAAPPGIQVADHHADFAVLAVQGPASDDVLAEAGLPHGHPYLSFVDTAHPAAAERVTVCRTGYTGELGYEIVTATADAGPVWDALLAAGRSRDIRRCGLGARDTLRTEMGYALHGHEIGPDISPVQARLGWAVGWDKPAFTGREALLAERERERPAGRRLWGLRATGRAIPRPGMAVTDPASGAVVGVVTSGTFSPTLRVGIALALLDRPLGPGADVRVSVRSSSEPFAVVRPPFVDRRPQ